MLTFHQLATAFDELERTPSRTELVGHLATLLDRAGAEEVASVSYLLQGRVAPLNAAVEFGLAEKTVLTAVARAYGVDHDAAQQRYHVLGDPGLLAQELAASSPVGATTVREIVEMYAQQRPGERV